MERDPISLVRELDASTGRAWRAWELETLYEHMGVTDDDVLSRDLLAACQVACTNPDVGTDWPLFLAVTSPFNGYQANFEWMHAPEPGLLAKTCHVLDALAPGIVIGPDVRRFIAVACWDAGLLYFPWIMPPINLVTDPGFKGLIEPELAPLVEAVIAGTPPNGEDAANPLDAQVTKIKLINDYLKAEAP